MLPRLFLLTALAAGLPAVAAESIANEPALPDTAMKSTHIDGTFEVDIAPQAADNEPAKSSGLARLSINKRYLGELEAIGQGEMLASGDGGSKGAYVALEKIVGTLQGRSGSFVLMHHAVLNQGAPENWKVTVVRDSGEGELAGLAGAMTIRIADGKHHYGFDFTLPGAVTP